MTPKAPAIVKRSTAASRAWRGLWALLADNGMDEEIYTPTVAILAVELGLADDASNAIYRPIDKDTGKRVKRTLEEYLVGRNSQTAQELTLLRDSLKHASILADKFGTSPYAQKKAGTTKAKNEESPMMAYIRAANERMRNQRVS